MLSLWMSVLRCQNRHHDDDDDDDDDERDGKEASSPLLVASKPSRCFVVVVVVVVVMTAVSYGVEYSESMDCPLPVRAASSERVVDKDGLVMPFLFPDGASTECRSIH